MNIPYLTSTSNQSLGHEVQYFHSQHEELPSNIIEEVEKKTRDSYAPGDSPNKRIYRLASNALASGTFFCSNLLVLQLKARLSPSIFPLRLTCSPLLPRGTLNRASKLKSPISARCNIRVIANTRARA